MKFLFLIIAILFLFVSCSNNNLERYHKLIKQYRNSIELIGIESKTNYEFFYVKIAEKHRYTESFRKYIEVDQFAIKINKILDSLITVNSKQKKESESVKLEKEDVLTLKSHLKALKKLGLSRIEDTIKNQGFINALNAIYLTENLQNNKALKLKAVESPQLLATLYKVKLDVIIFNNLMSDFLRSKIDGPCFAYYPPEVIVIPKSEKIYVGEPFTAEILFGGMDSTVPVSYLIEETEINGINNHVCFKTKAIERGILKKQGAFVFQSFRTGKDSIIPFAIQYEVLKK